MWASIIRGCLCVPGIPPLTIAIQEIWRLQFQNSNLFGDWLHVIGVLMWGWEKLEHYWLVVEYYVLLPVCTACTSKPFSQQLFACCYWTCPWPLISRGCVKDFERYVSLLLLPTSHVDIPSNLHPTEQEAMQDAWCEQTEDRIRQNIQSTVFRTSICHCWIQG